MPAVDPDIVPNIEPLPKALAMSTPPTPRALVIDDCDINRMLAMELLDIHGYRADEAADGASGLEMLRRSLYNVVLLDVSMPGMDGKTICKMIRADAGLRHLRVIAYTAHAFPGQLEHFMEVGFDSLLTKPVSVESIGAALQG